MENEPLDPLEQELRGICLREPSPLLDQRVLRACAPGVSGVRLWLRVAAGVAAGVAFGVLGVHASGLLAKPLAPAEARTPVQLPHQQVTPSAEMAGSPARIHKVWHALGEDRAIGSVDGKQVRRAEHVRVEEILLVEPENGRRLRLLVPREEILLYGEEPY